MEFSSLLFLNTPQFLFLTVIFSLVIKGCLLGILIPQGLKSQKFSQPWLFLVLILIGSMIGEFSWCLKLMRALIIPSLPYPIIVFFLRLAWCFLVVQYTALGLFLERLTQKKSQLNMLQKFIIAISGIACGYFVYLALFDSSLTSQTERYLAMAHTTFRSGPLEAQVMRNLAYWLFPVLVLPNLLIALNTVRTNKLPKIITKQLGILFKFLVIPFLIAEVLIAVSNNFTTVQKYEFAIVGTSVILITMIVYYCLRRVMGLRFLNFSGHVESSCEFNFIDDFKVVLEQLSNATTAQELHQITSSFFLNACQIPVRKTNLYIRQTQQKELAAPTHDTVDAVVEQFLSTHTAQLIEFLKEHKILIYDELVFSNFYEEESKRTAVVSFLESINADIFLPILDGDRLAAYIIVEANARPSKLYCTVERDELLVFARYLSNIIHLLQNRTIESLLQQEHQLKQEMYHKHQQINQYKESVRFFLKKTKQKKIGVIFYKQRIFTFANQAAKELVGINLNTHEGHPVTRKMKAIARQVQEYKSPQTTIIKDPHGVQLTVTGVPNLEKNNVILTVSYPDITDIVNGQLNLLYNPAKWDYLLYLQTTKIGHMINELIPGSGELMLNLKIDLLEQALGRQALLLEMPDDDVITFVKLLHTVSMRDQLHLLTLKSPCTTPDTAIKLFGDHPIIGTKNGDKSLFERLDSIGTLCIQNIEYTDKFTQENLALYLSSGYYQAYKSDQQLKSNVRLLATAGQPLTAFSQEHTFNSTLYAYFNKHTIAMPSLITLPEKELVELANGYAEQALASNDFKKMLELTDKDIQKIIDERPASLHALKMKVTKLLTQKSKRKKIEGDITFKPAEEITEAQLLHIAQLGKHALKDRKTMSLLWNRFKNQNKIATFLGVNRSSVNRRCREYNLTS